MCRPVNYSGPGRPLCATLPSEFSPMIEPLVTEPRLRHAPQQRRSDSARRRRAETVQMQLNSAAKAGDVASIGFALSEPTRRLDLDHPLRLAAKGRHREAACFLLASGADLARAFSPGHTTERGGKRLRLVQFLASCGADGSFILAYPSGRAA